MCTSVLSGCRPTEVRSGRKKTKMKEKKRKKKEEKKKLKKKERKKETKKKSTSVCLEQFLYVFAILDRNSVRNGHFLCS